MSNPSPDSYPARLVLDGVPRIGYNVHPSPFPGSLYAVLDYLGDRPAYDYLMGVTGAPFRRLWNRDDGGNVDLSHFGEAPVRRVFTALGRTWRRVPLEIEALLAGIKASLAAGVPPISFGVLGPPEAGVITGYDQNGAVLLGWSYFQPDPSKYFELTGWFETLSPGSHDWIIVSPGKNSTVPTEHDVLVSSLEWALDLARTARRPELPNHVSGLAAYDAWANDLEADADYPPDNPEVMSLRTMVYCDQCTMLEERHEAARFLRRMQPFAPPAAARLAAAAALYDQIGDLMTSLYQWPFDDPSGATVGLADAQKRRELAGYVRRAGEIEARAVGELEGASASIMQAGKQDFGIRIT